MTEITHDEIRELLPDLLHGGLPAELRALVEMHLASCAECAEELAVLRMVKDAPSFAPRIDAVKVASHFAPYRAAIPAQPAPARDWRRVATLVVAAVILVSVVIWRSAPDGARNDQRVAVSTARGTSSKTVSPMNNSTPVISPAAVPSGSRKVEARPVHELQLAEGLDGLSDGGVAQLLRDMNDLEALPAADPEPLGVGDSSEGNGTEGRL